MPRNCMSFEGRKTRHNTCKANDKVNGQIPSTRLGNEDANLFPAPATKSSASTSVVPQKGAKSQCMVNGYVNRWYKSAKLKKNQGGENSPVTETLAAGRVNGGGISGGISVNQASMDTQNSDQVGQQLSLPAGLKNHRKKKKYRHKNSFFRHNEDVCTKNFQPVMLNKHEEEDWEKEIEEATHTDRERAKPCGPEDVVHFALRDLSLCHADVVGLQVSNSYSPAVHHPQPVSWFRYSASTEPDQFADADV